MTNDPMTPAVRRWMKRTAATPPDAHRSARLVMTRLPQVRQRSRWWPFPVFYRWTGTPATDDTTEYQPAPVPALNGHRPTVIGRTQSMFSPVKAFTAAALVLAIGGVMLIAQPFQRQGGVPGAETDGTAPTWISGTISHAPLCTGPDSEQDGAVRHDWNSVCHPQRWRSSDARFTGEVSARFNEDVFQADEGTISVSTAAYYLRNDEGGWTCSTNSLLRGSEYTSEMVTGDTVRCIGEGGYEGLSALLVSQDDPLQPYPEEFVGLVFSGDFPPLPEPPAAE